MEDMTIDMTAFNNGDPGAFKKVFEKYCRPLCYFAIKMIRNREEAEDIVIQTLQKTFQRCKNFKTEENLKAYLYIAVRNSCLDYLKKNKIRLKDVDDCNNIPDENLVEKAELEAVKAMQMKEVYDAILTLSSSQKQILLMFWEGKSAAEIAAILNTSSANVRSQKSQALKQLGKKF